MRSRAAAAALLALAALAAAAPASAADTTPGNTALAKITLVNLSERAERLLPRDRTTVRLAVEAQGRDPVRLQNDINRRMAAALAVVHGAAGITSATTGYNVAAASDGVSSGASAGNPPQKAPVTWSGQQGLSLESQDEGALLALAGTLQQQGLVMTGLSADVSPAALRSVQEALTAEALQRLGERAGRIAAALHLRVLRYRSLTIGNAAASPPPGRMFAMAAAPRAMASPVAEAGDATVAVDIQAEAELGPPQP